MGALLWAFCHFIIILQYLRVQSARINRPAGSEREQYRRHLGLMGVEPGELIDSWHQKLAAIDVSKLWEYQRHLLDGERIFEGKGHFN